MRLLGGDPTVERLVGLARRKLDGRPAGSEDAAYARLEERMLARRASRPMRWVGVVALAAAIPLAVVGWRQITRSTPVLSYRVLNGVAVDGSRVVGGVDTHIQFSDGSEVSLAPGTETRIEDLKEHGGRVDLEDGRAHVAIIKRPKTSWLVYAGPYEVRVTGTRFDVGWSAGESVFELTMQNGSVVVTGPGAPGGVTLRAGQHAVGGLAGRPFVVDDRAARAAADEQAAGEQSLPAARPSTSHGAAAEAADQGAASGPATGAAPRAGADHGMAAVAPPVPMAVGARAGSDDARVQRGWRRQVALGNFGGVVEQAEQRGLERTLASASLDDLSALADAARYARRTELARRALLAERQRFGSSAPAREAAFFLGRIDEDADRSATTAMQWYERYLTESPTGPYAPQALGREMMLVYREKGRASATALAQDYLARYPRGGYAQVARRIVDPAAGASQK